MRPEQGEAEPRTKLPTWKNLFPFKSIVVAFSFWVKKSKKKSFLFVFVFQPEQEEKQAGAELCQAWQKLELVGLSLAFQTIKKGLQMA